MDEVLGSFAMHGVWITVMLKMMRIDDCGVNLDYDFRM